MSSLIITRGLYQTIESIKNSQYYDVKLKPAMNVPNATLIDHEFFETFNYLGVNFDGGIHGWFLWEMSCSGVSYEHYAHIPDLIKEIERKLHNPNLPVDIDHEVFKTDKVIPTSIILESIPPGKDGTEYKEKEISDTIDHFNINFKGTHYTRRNYYPRIRDIKKTEFLDIYRNDLRHIQNIDDVMHYYAVLNGEEEQEYETDIDDDLTAYQQDMRNDPENRIPEETNEVGNTAVGNVPEEEETAFQAYLDNMEFEFSIQNK
jgi:hypothetical protein